MSAKRQKHILHLLYSGLGGHGSVFFSLVEADTTKKYSYSAIFCGIEPVRDEYVNRCSQLNIPHSYIAKKPGLDLKVYREIFRELQRRAPDTVFLHGVSLMIPAMFFKLFNPSVRVIVRETQAHHLKSRIEWVWLFFCLLFASKLVVLTKEAKEGIRKRFGPFASRSKFVIIPNGLDTDIFRPKPYIARGRLIKIGMQSRLQPIKDHPTLIKAFKLLTRDYPQLDLQLEIAGDGETMNSLTRLISELGLDGKVVMYGMLGQKELVEFMQGLDVYVHATFGETMSNSIMQAMACGLPVIASNVWGVNNMIRHEDNGLLYPSGDVEKLAFQMGLVLENKDLRERLMQRAREFALNHYSRSIMFDSYQSIY